MLCHKKGKAPPNRMFCMRLIPSVSGPGNPPQAFRHLPDFSFRVHSLFLMRRPFQVEMNIHIQSEVYHNIEETSTEFPC